MVRLADGESGLSARTIARRLSSVSGPYAYLGARGDTPVQMIPVPQGPDLAAGRVGAVVDAAAGAGAADAAGDLDPQEADRLVAALRTHRDRRWCWLCWPPAPL